MSYRLVALDIDGTLVAKDKDISEANRAAIQAVQQAGVLITLATGRMFSATRPVARQLEINLPLITHQGSVIRYALSGETLFQQNIDDHLALELTRFFEKYTGNVYLYVDDILVASKDDAITRNYAAKFPEVELHTVCGISAWLFNAGLQRALTKLAYAAPAEQIDAMFSDLARNFGNDMELTRTYPGFVEIGPKGVHKGSALVWLAEHFDIPLSQTLVIGDSVNDIDMFRVAGLAVAMSDAQEAAKKSAHAITAACAEDGVALALRHYVLRQ